MNDELTSLVSDFVGKLHDTWKRHAVEALTGVSGSPKKGTGRNETNGNGHAVANGRKKGEKRTADEMDAIADKFLAYVRRNPGLRVEQINKELGTTTKDLQLPIRKMISDGTLKAKGEKRSTTYSAAK